jgi:hypothetical protein
VRLESLVSRLERARPSGAGWIASCPAHEDRSPSLSIRQSQGGRILLHCFAGCSTEAICETLNIKISDLFSEPGRCTPAPRIVREAQKQISDLRSRLTLREREVAEIIVIETDRTNIDAAIARALALAIEGELVQIAFSEERDAA